MQDINTIYQNSFGIAFQWKRCTAKDYKKVQVVFRNTGLFLNKEELKLFSEQIECTVDREGLCAECKENQECRALLVETPAPQIAFAVSHTELHQMQDLINGTLFQLGLNNILKDII